MDAKPQRPVRSLRVHDENVPIANQLPGKTIHQRNKSTPALSGLMQYAASRGVVKRTAFADLSNTARVQPAQDDSAINGKIVVNMQDFKQPAALLKPAQRALAAKPSNQQLTAASVTTSSVPVKAAAAVTTASQGQAAVPRKIAPKRSASVLKDAATTVVSVETVTTEQEQDVVPARSATSTTQSTALPELDAITEEAVSAAGPVQPVDAPVASNAVEEHYILALEHQAQAVDVLARNDTIQDEDEEEFHQDECTRNMTTGGVTGTTVVLAPRYTKKVQQELLEARTAVEGSRTEEEVEDEQWDTSMVAEYGDEIFEYMRELEERMRPNPHYMNFQHDIQWSMRSVLVDWVVQVHGRFQLLPETLFLAVNYIDRFLSSKVVSMGKLQLVGATALFLAAKYEEVNCPSIQEIVYMVDNGYSQEEILKAERFMLSILGYSLGWPGPMSFLRRISKADDYDLETRTLAKYFLEITICDERFVGCNPSFTAAGAHCLARLMLHKGEWTPAHVYYANYTYSQIRHLLATLIECCEEPEKHHAAVFSKYSDKRFKRASLFVQTEMKKGFKLPSYKQTGFRDDTRDW